MKAQDIFKTAALAGLVFLSGLSGRGLAAGAVDLADRPLYLQARITPGFIMTIDNSGSMDWEILSPNQDGEYVWGRDSAAGTDWGFFRNNGTLRPDANDSGTNSNFNRIPEFLELFPYQGRGTKRKAIPPIPAFGFARSPEFNAGYYDPAATYEPWLHYDGTSWGSLDTQAKWESVKIDPRVGMGTEFDPGSPNINGQATLVYDLTQDISDRADDDRDGTIHVIRALASGDVLPAGTIIRGGSTTNSVYCPATPSNITDIPRSNQTPIVLNQTYTINGNCRTAASTANRVVNIVHWDVNSDWPHTDETFHVYPGMTIPAGTQYFIRADYSSGNCSVFNTRYAWTTLTSDVTVPGVPSNSSPCRVAFRYYAPTYYLTTNTSPDGNLVPTMITPQPGGVNANTPPSNGVLYRYEIKPGHYPSHADYEKAMTNFANWFAYYRSRNLAMVGALSRSLADVTTMRIGQFQINDTAYTYTNTQGNTATAYNNYVDPVVMHEMDEFANDTSVAGRKRLYGQIFRLGTVGSTPNGPAVMAIGEQFKRTTGTADPVSGAPVLDACQVTAGMLFTDGYSNIDPSAGVGNVDGTADADTGFGTNPYTDTRSNTMADIAAHYYKTDLRPDLTGAHVRMNFYGITLGASGNQFGVHYTQDPVTMEITPDPFVTTPTWPGSGWWGATRAGVDDIWHATINARGEFINATSPEAISKAMNRILTSVLERASVSGGTAASGTRREDGFLAYVPYYDPSGTPARWTGNLKANRLTASGALGAQEWDAATRLNAMPLADRKVHFIDDNGTLRSLKDEASFLPASTVAALDSVVVDLCPGTTPANTCTSSDVIEYLRGDHSKEERNGGPFRNRMLNVDGADRPSRIGDILGSQPEVLSKASYGYSTLPNSMGGNTYQTFLNGEKRTRTQLVFVGSNNGMIHAFNARTGDEAWAVIPNSVLTDNIEADGSRTDSSRATFVDLARPDYDHRYFVDGSPSQGDVYVGGGWKTYLAVPMGAGARSVVVLDVTNGTTPSLVSEIKHADIGYGVNRPRIAPLKNQRWAVVFGNGYNSDDHRSRLIVQDLANTSPTVVTVGVAGSGTAADPNGMAGGVALADDDFDGLADAIYAGDYKGNLWKFPVTAASGVSAATTPFFQARAPNSTIQHITGGVDVMAHHDYGQMVFFGTGRYMINADRSQPPSPPIQTFYGVWDKGWTAPGTASSPGSTLTRSNLAAQTLTTETDADGTSIRKSSANPVNWINQSGWRLDLAPVSSGVSSAQGERFVGVPAVVLGKVIFTTFRLNTDGNVCGSTGYNYLNVLDATNGAATLSYNGQDGVSSIRLPDTSSGGGPVERPPVVSTGGSNQGCDPSDPSCTPPEPEEPEPCDPSDPGCTPPCDPSDPSCAPPINPVGAVGCVNDIGILLSSQLLNFTSLTCGRQSWRQVE